MRIERIKLFQFKNYRDCTFSFEKPLVAVVGPNGEGKTNLLDAIYYLGFTKSYFNSVEKNNVIHGGDAFRIEGDFRNEDKREEVACVFRKGKKEISLNKSIYNRFSRHIGKLPIIFIAPDDLVLITGGSGKRRKFYDMLLSQLENGYLENLITYQKILAQRNSFLKDCRGELRQVDLLKTFDEQLSGVGVKIFEIRRDFLPVLSEKVNFFYQYLSEGKENIDIHYQSDLLKGSFTEILEDSCQRDILLGYTSKGVHRDDLEFLMDQNPFDTEGSQGQKKSFVLALKLAQMEILTEQKGFIPILLLDDIFEKLDHFRVNRLMDLICGEKIDQVFFSDTEEDRLSNLFKERGVEIQVVELGKSS